MSSAPSSSLYTRAWLRPNSPVPTTATRIFFDSPAAALILCLFPLRHHLVPEQRAEGRPESQFPLHPPIRSVLPGQKEAFVQRPTQERSRPHPSSVRSYANRPRVH